MNNRVAELGKNLLDKLLAEPPTNLMYVVREHYDFWNEVLFPVLVERRIPTYETVAGILVEAGYPNANKDMVRKYFYRVGKKRGKQAVASNQAQAIQPSTRAPTDGQSHNPALHQGNMPIVAPVVDPVASATVSKQPWKWTAESKRLGDEYFNDFQNCAWSNVDSSILDYFEGLGKKYSVTIENLKTVKTIRDKLNDNEDIAKCLMYLVEKRKHFNTVIPE